MRFLRNLLNIRPKILKHPNRALSMVAEDVDFVKIPLKKRIKIVSKMGQALLATKGGYHLGIAAPQIGEGLRIIIVQGNVMFNPEFRAPQIFKAVDSDEACYSAKPILYRVSRAPYGWVSYTNIDGVKMERRVKDLPAIVLQHEIDHLDGKCLPDTGFSLEKVVGEW